MTPLRSIILAAVTVLVVGALPGAALAVPCDSSEDCAPGSRCAKQKNPTKPGVCVARPKPKGAQAVHRIPCEDSQDCAVGSRCDHKPGKTGFCVGTGSKK
jgi:hypothetical protein